MQSLFVFPYCNTFRQGGASLGVQKSEVVKIHICVNNCFKFWLFRPLIFSEYLKHRAYLKHWDSSYSIPLKNLCTQIWNFPPLFQVSYCCIHEQKESSESMYCIFLLLVAYRQYRQQQCSNVQSQLTHWRWVNSTLRYDIQPHNWLTSSESIPPSL